MNLGSGPCEDDASQGAYDFKEVQTTLADLLADMQKDKNGYRIFLEPHDLSKYMAGTKSINVARFQRDARTRCKIFFLRMAHSRLSVSTKQDILTQDPIRCTAWSYLDIYLI
jgi:hypothetical protein